MEVFLLFWLGFAIALAIWASQRGRSAFGWFVLAVLISPLLAAVFLAVLPRRGAAAPPGPGTHVRCPECAEWVLPQARRCKHCGAGLTSSQG